MRRIVIGLVTALVLASPQAATVLAADKDLILHYGFDQSAGNTVSDASGNDNHGKVVAARFVPRGDGYAVRFDGPSQYVDCGNLNKQADKALTLAFWLYLQDVPLVEAEILAKDGAYSVVAGGQCWLYTYWNGSPKNCMVETGGLFPTALWRHIALVFDGSSVRCYENGRFLPGRSVDYTGAFVTSPVDLRELAPGGPLHIGWKCTAAGEDLPLLMMDDLRVYARALSQDEVVALYRQTALPQIEVKPYLYRFADEVILRLDAGALTPLPSGARAEILVQKKAEARPAITESVVLSQDKAVTEVRLPMGEASPGDYEVAVDLLAADGSPIGTQSVTPMTWPEKPSWPEARDLNVLNALVTELLNVQSPETPDPVYRFVNPRDGWVFFATTAKSPVGGRLEITLDPHPRGRATPLVINHAGDVPTVEAMRLLPKGEYTLKMDLQDGFVLDHLVVRAIPELGEGLPTMPCVKSYPAYDWDFMEKDLSPNLNYSAASWHMGGRGRAAWRAQGKLCLGAARGIDPPMTAEKGAAAYAAALDNPDVDGIHVDEIGWPGHHPVTAPALRLLASERTDLFSPDAPLRKCVNPYSYGKATTFQNTPAARDLLEAVIACNGHFVEEMYIPTQPDEARARASLDTVLTSWMVGARRSYPQAPAVSAALFAAFMHPAHPGVDMHADVDYHAFMEMQVRTVALHHDFFGLRGVMLYAAQYTDEEMVRWWGRLLRHYCIEGRTDRLWNGPYKLTHLRNPDFSKGMEGWDVSPAEPGTIFMSDSDKCGQVIQHWSQGANVPRLPGADVLVMRRSRSGPNTVSQEIKGLEPGRLYSLHYSTADYGDLVRAKAEGTALVDTPAKPVVISAAIDRVDLLPEKSFVYQGMGGYDTTGNWVNKPCALNFHRLVFRANADTSTITFTDWSQLGGPLGPDGQENLLAWVKVQPYLED